MNNIDITTICCICDGHENPFHNELSKTILYDISSIESFIQIKRNGLENKQEFTHLDCWERR